MVDHVNAVKFPDTNLTSIAYSNLRLLKPGTLKTICGQAPPDSANTLIALLELFVTALCLCVRMVFPVV